MSKSSVTIGQAADLTGLTPKAIRLYEARGLIGPAFRTSGGYRTYGPEEIAVLRFVRQAKSIGLRLEEIGQIIDLQRSEGRPCGMVVELLDRRLAGIDRAIADLRAVRATLSNARDQAEQAMRSGREAVVCSVIESAAP